MNSNNPLKCLSVLNVPSKKILAFQTYHPKYEKYFYGQVQELALDLSKTIFTSNRELNGSIKMGEFSWNYKIDYNNNAFLTLSEENFERKNVLKIQNDLEKFLFNNPIEYEDDRRIIERLQNMMKEIMNKFNEEAEKQDKFNLVNDHLENIKDAMGNNIKHIIENKEQLEIIEKKTEELANMAKKYQEQGVAVRKKFQTNRIFFYIFLITLAFAFILILFTIILVSGQNTEENKPINNLPIVNVNNTSENQARSHARERKKILNKELRKDDKNMNTKTKNGIKKRKIHWT